MLVQSGFFILSFQYLTVEDGNILLGDEETPQDESLETVVTVNIFFGFRGVFITGEERRHCVVRKRCPLIV
jgi:hypothetical protein